MNGEHDERIRTLPAAELLGPFNEVEEKYAPKLFYVAGHTEVFAAGPRVAIIGSRKASSAGLRQAAALATALVHEGVTIVSGLAAGIDTAAHRAAIDAGGRTIAVLGTPLDQCYPQQNRELQDLIMRDHLAISQFASGRPIERKNFPLRNRTTALISHASIIIEAGDTSGSLHQGWEALRLGRPLFITEAIASNSAVSWPAKMRAYGAVVFSKPEEVLEALPASGLGLDEDLALWPSSASGKRF